VPFATNLPVSIRSIPFYSADACGVTPATAAAAAKLQKQERLHKIKQLEENREGEKGGEKVGGGEQIEKTVDESVATVIGPDGRMLRVNPGTATATEAGTDDEIIKKHAHSRTRNYH
jgi:hypothetical protein